MKTCPYCNRMTKEEWLFTLRRGATLFDINEFERDRLALSILAQRDVCICPEDAEFRRLEEIDPFNREQAPYPISLYEIEGRIPELFEKEIQANSVDFDGSDFELRKQVAISLFRRSSDEWAQLGKDEDVLLHRQSREHWKFRKFFQALLDGDESIEEVLLRLIPSTNYDIFHTKGENYGKS